MLLTSCALLTLSFASCGYSPGQTLGQIDPGKITSINIIDRNGFSETISSQDRLNAFNNTDFLSAQPYQKVLRVYGRGKEGDIRSCITSYHPNGEPKQYLDAVNNRAFGDYREWHPNGALKIEAKVIGGNADLNTHAEQTWLFEGWNRAWNEEGKLIAEIPYSKGELEGEALYYHQNGSIWKSSPYTKSLLNGEQKIYLEDGTLLQTARYVNGLKEGNCDRNWTTSQVAYHEYYASGRLIEAQYFDSNGEEISVIAEGMGERAILGKIGLEELQEFKNGFQEGRVSVYDETGHLTRLYHIKEGLKHGEEIDYFAHTSQPKLLLSWYHGAIQGCVKTWYENGQLESQRELCANKKNGLFTAWYQNGALMLVEEYDADSLLKGEYYRVGEKIHVSKIESGSGIATLFTPEGNFSRKVCYRAGKPVE